MNRQRPICTGTNSKGELTWTWVPMELWHILQLYKRQYVGDFGEHWMRMVIYDKMGMGWDD